MSTKFQALRRSILAALMSLLAFTAVYTLVPVQAAAAMAEKGESAAEANSFDFHMLYGHDGAKPSAADSGPINVVVMDNGKAVAHASNLQYGQRFNASLPDGIYKVQVYNRETGKLIDTINLAHSTDHKDNDLTVTLRLPNTSLTPAPTVRYQVREE